MLAKVQSVVEHALDSLEIQYGASHSELKISESGDIKLIEIGGRMGGDNIGATLVRLSTGYDFLSGVIDVALGIEPKVEITDKGVAGIRFIFNEKDVEVLNRLKVENPEILEEDDVHEITNTKVTDSGSRFGYFLFASKDKKIIDKYMPD